jgi:hypothetical protein
MRLNGFRSLALIVGAVSLACVKSRTTTAGGLPADPTRTAVTGQVPGQRATASSQPNASRKRVDAKEDPATLVAVDRTRCTVTEPRFRDTKVGDSVTCDWRTGDRAP